MGAEDRLYTLEYDLFCDVRDQIAAEVLRIQSTAKAIAGIDVFTSLSTVSMRNNYVKPKIDEGVINIKNGRHPVVEKMIKDSLFVANDTYLDVERGRLNFGYYFINIILPETIFTVVTTLILYRLFLYISRKLEEMEKRRDTTIV